MTLDEKRMQYAKEDFDLFQAVDMKQMEALARRDPGGKNRLCRRLGTGRRYR